MEDEPVLPTEVVPALLLLPSAGPWNVCRIALEGRVSLMLPLLLWSSLEFSPANTVLLS